MREFLLTEAGVDLLNVCVSTNGAVTGSARREYESQHREAAPRQKDEISRKQEHLERQRQEMDLSHCIQTIKDIEARGKNDREAMTRSPGDEAPAQTSLRLMAAAGG